MFEDYLDNEMEMVMRSWSIPFDTLDLLSQQQQQQQQNSAKNQIRALLN